MVECYLEEKEWSYKSRDPQRSLKYIGQVESVQQGLHCMFCVSHR